MPMSTYEVGTKLVELCKQGKYKQAMETLYAPDIASIEAASSPGMPRETRGLPAVMAKDKAWGDNHTIHDQGVAGPYPHGDRFIVHFSFDVTNKQTNRRMKMDEMGLYTVRDGKIAHEEFFYVMGQ